MNALAKGEKSDDDQDHELDHEDEHDRLQLRHLQLRSGVPLRSLSRAGESDRTPMR